ncbi:hypothetical protein [Asticcacaulis taihuensis]|uniref:Uncharacterized protein n=1 Tax=Asticcacaulis taihuensis TaxID=260084 RepID=A0A1G4R7V5_9CAUL|nr:hypothetical protein [Asticcacaulis taihuensis]SCW52721.1 hypothetical protein SAMN02927928_1625 [Asticcacaulis taihuensis]
MTWRRYILSSLAAMAVSLTAVPANAHEAVLLSSEQKTSGPAV